MHRGRARQLRDGDELIVVTDRLPGRCRTASACCSPDPTGHEPGREARPRARRCSRRCLRVPRRRRLPGRRLDRAGRRAVRRPVDRGRRRPGGDTAGIGWRERAGGAFYESVLGAVAFATASARRAGSRRRRLPAYNFFVRTERAARGRRLELDASTAARTRSSAWRCVEAGHRIVYDPERARLSHPPADVRAAHAPGRRTSAATAATSCAPIPETSARPLYFAPSAALIAGAAALAWAREAAPRAAAATALGPRRWRRDRRARSARRPRSRRRRRCCRPCCRRAHGAYGAGFLRGLVTADDRARCERRSPGSASSSRP